MAWRVYNYGGSRIGDKIGASMLIQYQIEEKGDKFILIDPSWDSHTSFPVRQFFPQISNYVIETKNSDEITNTLIGKGFEHFGTGNIWITAPSLKLDTGYTPSMYLPKYIKDFMNKLVVESEDKTLKKRLLDFDIKIVNHCLTDPAYNVGRQHNPEQWMSLMKRIREYLLEQNIDGVVADIPQYTLPFQQAIGIIACGDIFIGGDTGSTHVAGALKKNIVAIYGNSDHDVKAFPRGEQSHDWCSDPLSDTYTKFVMTDHKFDEDEVFEHIKTQIAKHLEGKVVVK